MSNKIQKVLKVLLEPKTLKILMSMRSTGYLKDIGWFEAFKNKMPIDANKNPLPWVTYSFIHFMENRLNKNMDIFEYGSGNSTFWYAKRVNSVTSIEHDKIWYDKIKKETPKNSTIIYQKLDSNKKYSTYLSSINKKFDIIIVDGMERVDCLKQSISSLKMGGGSSLG